MKKRPVLGYILLGATLLGGLTYASSTTEATEEITELIELQPVIIETDDAGLAMDLIYKSITIVEQDLELGFVKATITNPTSYPFSSILVDMEFVDEENRGYYLETVFLIDGLKSGETKDLYFTINDLSMLDNLSWFNFCTQGF